MTESTVSEGSTGKKRWVTGLRIVLGLVFLFSGAVKVLDARSFLALLQSSYQLPALLVALALVVPALELFIGCALLLGVAVRRMALSTLALMGIFSLIIVYGALFGEVEACGCFGAFLELSPWAAVARNVVLAVLAFLVWKHAGTAAKPVRGRLAVLGAALLLGGFFTGFTFHDPLLDRSPTDVYDTFPTAFSGDAPAIAGKQLVFIFKPDCPHCWNAVAIVDEHVEEGVMDVFGVTAGDDAEVAEFVAHLEPEFPIYRFGEEDFLASFRSWPTLFYLDEGVIKGKFEGDEIPSPYNLERMFEAARAARAGE